jgi:hypothetical protein
MGGLDWTSAWGLGRVETLSRGYQVVVVVGFWGFSTRTDAIGA